MLTFDSLDRDQFAIVARTTAAIAAAETIEAALHALLRGMTALTGADRGGVRLLPTEPSPDGYCDLAYFQAPDRLEWRRIQNLPGSNTARVQASGRGEYSPDLAAAAAAGDTSAHEALTIDGTRSSVIVPLHTAGHIIGTLHADAGRPHAFAEGVLLPLQVLADHAAGAVEQARRRGQADARLRWLEAAQRVSAAVNAAGDLDALLRLLLQEVLDVMGAQRGAVLLADADRRHLRIRLTLGYPPGTFDTIVRELHPEERPDEDVYASVVRRQEQRVISASHPARYRPNIIGLPAAFRVLTPIQFGGEAIGVYSAVWTDREEASSEDLALLRMLAEQAGGAVARAHLAEAEQQAQAQLVAALHNSGTVAYSYDGAGRLDSIVGDIDELIGWTAEELIGRSVLLLADNTDRSEMKAYVLRRLAGNNEVWQRETLLRHRSGADVPVLVAAAPRLVRGETAGGTGVITDLRCIKEVQAELDRALSLQARAEGAMRTGRAVGHELGSPLGAIVGLASLLLDNPRLPADVMEDLRVLAAEADRAGMLLHRFAQITRYEEMPTPIGPQLDVHRASERAET